METAIRNVFKPGEVWSDTDGVHINAHGGGIVLHEGIYYWFGEFKTAGASGNTAMVGVSCYSSADLYTWKNLGIALSVSDNPQSDITRGCILERPKVLCCASTKQFVMGFHLEPKGAGYRGARYSLAVSDTIAGPYRFVRSYRPNAGCWPVNSSPEERRLLTPEEHAQIAALQLRGGPVPAYPTDLIFRRDYPGGQMSRDMTLFRDDDGTAYHLYASEENGVLHIARLSEDLLSHTGRFVRVLPGRFNEAPAIFKRRGKYYLITSGCTGWNPNPARLAVADDIFGPWQELPNPCRGTADQLATTFGSQSTYVLPIAGRDDAFIFMADRWQPVNPIDGRYVWLPIQFDAGTGHPYLEWMDEWDLSFLDRRPVEHHGAK